jgi:hypothetical protein
MCVCVCVFFDARKCKEKRLFFFQYGFDNLECVCGLESKESMASCKLCFARRSQTHLHIRDSNVSLVLL